MTNVRVCYLEHLELRIVSRLAAPPRACHLHADLYKASFKGDFTSMDWTMDWTSVDHLIALFVCVSRLPDGAMVLLTRI